MTNDEHNSDKSTLPKYRPKKAREPADVTSVRSPLFKHRPRDFLSLSLSSTKSRPANNLIFRLEKRGHTARRSLTG